MSKFEVPKLPEVSFTKTGFEIRQNVLEMAKDFVMQEYNYKFHNWEITQQRDNKGQILTSVSMPEFPGIEKILEASEKFYGFINTVTPTSKK